MRGLSNNEFKERFGPWALVAGASQGLGAEFAAQLASKGLHVIIAARSADKLQTLATRLTAAYGVQVHTIVIDLAQHDAATSVAEQTSDLDIGLLVFNGAHSVIGPFLAQPVEEHERELDTNCHGPMTFAYVFGQRFLARKRGGMVLMSSLSSSQGSALIANYSATKAYNQILAEGLWEELRGQGVDVIACCAGAISTPNYLTSLPERADSNPAPTMSPAAVVGETLAALGRQPSIVPGRINRTLAFVMTRLLPRRMAINMMGRTLRRMYKGG